MPERPTHGDPPPIPPERPSSDDCCRSGCDPCVFDLYDEALERYRADLQAWQQRHARSSEAASRTADP